VRAVRAYAPAFGESEDAHLETGPSGNPNGDDARVLVVGHEPDFSQVVHDLTGAQIDMKKGGVAGLRVDGGRGELIVLLRPRELERLA